MDKRILTGGNHLASALVNMGIAPAEVRHLDYEAFLEKHGQPAADIFIAWKAIMDVRDETQRYN